MKKQLIILLICPLFLAAQPGIQWQRTLGGSQPEEARAVAETLDKGFILTGYTVSEDGDVVGNDGGVDVWVVKLDSTGEVQWKRTYGGSSYDLSKDIHQTRDGGYIIAGSTESNDGDVSGNHGDRDMWALKLDSNGTIEWQKALGGSGWEEGWAVQQTADGGYILAGFASSTDGDVTGYQGFFDYWVVKLSSSGELEWQRTLGGTDLDIAYAVSQTSDGGYVVVGEDYSLDGDVKNGYGNGDYWVVKLNFEGKIEWEKSLGGTSIERGNDIHQTRDGGYIVFGMARSTTGDVTGNHGVYDCWAVKLDQAGNIEWQKALGGSDEDFGHSIQQTEDGGYVLSASIYSNDGDVVGDKGAEDVWVVKLTETGEIQWQKVLGGSSDDRAFAIHETLDGGFIFAGDTWSNDGDVSGNHGKTDYWVVKLSPAPSGTEDVLPLPLEVSPNPALHTIFIQLPAEETPSSFIISDQTGKVLLRQTGPLGGPDGYAIDVSALPGGMYIISSTAVSGRLYSGKFVKG